MEFLPFNRAALCALIHAQAVELKFLRRRCAVWIRKAIHEAKPGDAIDVSVDDYNITFCIPSDDDAEGTTPPESSARQKFNRLMKTWQKETVFMSSSYDIVLNLSYQQIIGMGPPAIPLILEQLQTGVYHQWFWALKAISGEDPVPELMRGKVKEMARVWLEWGERYPSCPKCTTVRCPRCQVRWLELCTT